VDYLLTLRFFALFEGYAVPSVGNSFVWLLWCNCCSSCSGQMEATECIARCCDLPGCV
jgi:hypothetical protein